METRWWNAVGCVASDIISSVLPQKFTGIRNGFARIVPFKINYNDCMHFPNYYYKCFIVDMCITITIMHFVLFCCSFSFMAYVYNRYFDTSNVYHNIWSIMCKNILILCIILVCCVIISC